MNELAIGVDLGATKIATALVDRDGRIRCARKTATRAEEGPAAVCDRIASEVRALIGEATGPIAGVGIGTPGCVNAEAGIVTNAVNLGWDRVHLVGEISQRLNGLRVIIENDANANALGEGYFGCAVGCNDYVLLTIGSGLGCGVVSNGRLITGAHWVAADLGHYAIDPDHGRLCVCGRRGCAETIVSGPGLAAIARAGLGAEEIVGSALSGPGACRGAVALMAGALGHVAAVAAAVVDPELVVIGGGLGVAAFDLICEPAQREMHRRLPVTLDHAVQWKVATLASPALGGASLVRAQRALGGADHENALG